MVQIMAQIVKSKYWVNLINKKIKEIMEVFWNAIVVYCEIQGL